MIAKQWKSSEIIKIKKIVYVASHGYVDEINDTEVSKNTSIR